MYTASVAHIKLTPQTWTGRVGKTHTEFVTEFAFELPPFSYCDACEISWPAAKLAPRYAAGFLSALTHGPKFGLRDTIFSASRKLKLFISTAWRLTCQNGGNSGNWARQQVLTDKKEVKRDLILYPYLLHRLTPKEEHRSKKGGVVELNLQCTVSHGSLSLFVPTFLWN